MSPQTHLERATEAATYTDRLRSDLASLADTLSGYAGTRGIDALREQGWQIQGMLKAISGRLSALGRSADPDKYCLSETEHEVLENASDHRSLMMEVLHTCQCLRKHGAFNVPSLPLIPAPAFHSPGHA